MEKIKDFKNDVLFKYLLRNDKDQESVYLLKLIIENILHIHVSSLYVLNPDINVQDDLERSLYLDIAVQLDSGEIINVEMQNSNFSKAYSLITYGCKSIISQCHKEDPYYAEYVNPVYQIIFIDDVDEDSAKMVDTYSLRNEEGDSMMDNLITISFVQLPYINEIVKEKGIKQLTKFELILYIFKNGITDDIREVKDEVIEIMEKKRETFNQNDNLKMAAFNFEIKNAEFKD